MALQRNGAQGGAGGDDLLFVRGGTALLPEVEREGAEHGTLRPADRRGPARLEPQGQDWFLEVDPARIGCDIRHRDRRFEIGGTSAGADLRPDHQPFKQRAIRGRKTGPGERVQQPIALDAQDGTPDARQIQFDFTTETIRRRLESIHVRR